MVIPVYNASAYLREALESVLQQTFTKFELLVMDDGSTDNSVEIVNSYHDQRIRIITNTHNFIATLNKGIDSATSKYIARMDADDVMLPHRLEIQYKFMETHPDIDICGTYAESFGIRQTVITQKAISGKTEIIPSLKWKYDDLKHLSQAGTVDMTFVCYAGNKELGRETLKLNYRPVNECILYYSENDDEGNNVTPLLAAYVNENSPVIDAFMKEVLDADTLITAFTGYQAGADEVINQVDAIFTALRKKGIKYSDLAAGSLTVTDYLMSQHVRFADEVLTNTQANCADGTVFFCSVLQKIGIHSMMVFEPGHVYLGYFTDNDKKELQILETTAVGDKDVSFQVATSINIDKFNENLDKYNNEDVFDSYFLVDVSEARKLINPIGR